jgi:hypothetical protein
MATTLRTLSVDLWDSVTRIADGIEPDDIDRRAIDLAISTMRSEIEVLEWVGRNCTGPQPSRTNLSSSQQWGQKIWMAVCQLESKEDFGGSPLAALQQLADKLEKIRRGDRAEAKALDRVVERIARLVEMYQHRDEDEDNVLM